MILTEREPETTLSSDAAMRVPAYVILLSAGISLQFMSGQASNYGLPLAPDRLLIPAAIMLFLTHPDSRSHRWHLRPVHLLLVASLALALSSMITSGSIRSADARFSFWDAYGALPFLLFVIAPVVYRSEARRRTLLVSLTILGGYLGTLALFQGLRLESLIYPRYIIDATSSHYGRAFGPSLQVGSNGLQLFACMAAATTLSLRSRGLVRWASRLVAVLCAAGLFFTMTRSLWIGAVLGVAVALMLDRRTRRHVLTGAIAMPIGVAAVLLASPTIRAMTIGRVGEEGSAYDRINATATALDVVQYLPFSGVGYNNFYLVEDSWFWQLDTTPVAATGIAVHNVFLGLAVEIGLPGMIVWAVTLLLATKGLWRALPAEPEQRLWRQAALGYFVCWFTAAMLMPISYALPSSLLWILLGIVTRPEDVGFGSGSTTQASTSEV